MLGRLPLKRYKKAAVGGTFSVIHEGHKRLLERAFGVAEHVVIGLTTDKYARAIKPYDVPPFEERRENLKKYLVAAGHTDWTIVELSDPYGPAATDPTIEAIVVSEETLPTAREINDLRITRGLKPLAIEVVKLVRDKEGRKVASRDVVGGRD